MSTAAGLLDIPVQRIDGTGTSLAEHLGKVVLVVNVASKCGFTSQYAGLEALYRQHREHGLVVCGFPSNDFAGQEPASNQEIASFCQTSFAVDFPLYAKIPVTGAAKHPLYAALVAAQPATLGDTAGLRKDLQNFGATTTAEPEVLWNFEKFLLGRDGAVVGRFASNVAPDSPELRRAIEAELAKS
ncbi:MAG TPA: glutathione peroxidase [Acidobacteriaceae bacterium]